MWGHLSRFVIFLSIAFLSIAALSGCCSISGGCSVTGPAELAAWDGLQSDTTKAGVEEPKAKPEVLHRTQESNATPTEPYSWEWLAREEAKKRQEDARFSKLLTICQGCIPTPGKAKNFELSQTSRPPEQ